MTEPKQRRTREPQAPKKVFFFSGSMQCIRCANEWETRDLNTERKVVPCPICNQPNEIKDARFRATQVTDK